MLKSIPSGSGVIINWRCSGAPERVPKQFYYPNGDIVGSLAYWYNRPIRELWVSNYHYENKEEQDIQYVYTNLQLSDHVQIQGGTGGPDPVENHIAIGFLRNTGTEPPRKREVQLLLEGGQYGPL